MDWKDSASGPCVGRLKQEPPKEQEAEDDHDRDDDNFYETHVAPRRSELRRILKAASRPVNPLNCKELLSRGSMATYTKLDGVDITAGLGGHLAWKTGEACIKTQLACRSHRYRYGF